MDPNGLPPTGSMPPAYYPPMGGPKPPVPTGMPAFNPDPSTNPPMHFKQGNMPQPPLNMAPASMMNPQIPHISEKNREFARGVYISGFERTLTAEMLQEHFKIKPIKGLKLPMSKFNENKGFAFIYY